VILRKRIKIGAVATPYKNSPLEGNVASLLGYLEALWHFLQLSAKPQKGESSVVVRKLVGGIADSPA